MIFDYALSWHAELDPSEVMFVGDTWEIDILGSQAVGMIPVWVNTGYESEEREGVAVISDIAEICRILS
jgi:FMN phosphatase YigB (HAD superfamily)